ncbi:MAG: Hsp20/alpha crystallin family protein [Gammaproteobacteria bacterium]|nr:Hsp20/alpha crystallin family protein [Gammaproteobacteria bacterium]
MKSTAEKRLSLKPWNWFNREADQHKSTSLTRHNDPLTSMHDQLDRMFDRFLADFPTPFGNSGTLETMILRPQLDIAESDKHYTVAVEVPGVNEDDIDITLEQNLLTISGEKKQESSKDENGFHKVERSYGSFQRVLNLPDDADSNDIKADVKKGVLKIRIGRSKPDKATSHRIPIGR